VPQFAAGSTVGSDALDPHADAASNTNHNPDTRTGPRIAKFCT